MRYKPAAAPAYQAWLIFVTITITQCRTSNLLSTYLIEFYMSLPILQSCIAAFTLRQLAAARATAD
jgi:hypothetical protein